MRHCRASAAQIHDTASDSIRFEETDLCTCIGPERDAAIDALSTGKEFPLVIIGETLVCAGELDLSAIVEAVERSFALR